MVKRIYISDTYFRDLTKLEDGLGEKVVMAVHFFSAFLGSLILALVKGWQLALVCMASVPVSFLLIGVAAVVRQSNPYMYFCIYMLFFALQITARLAKREMEAYAHAGSIAEEAFSAIRTVVAFSGEKAESERYAINLQEARSVNIRKSFFGGLSFGMLWFCIYATYSLSFWYGSSLVLEHRKLSPEKAIYDPGVMFTVYDLSKTTVVFYTFLFSSNRYLCRS